MFKESISLIEAEARFHEIADSFILLLSSCLFFSDNFLESSNPSISIELSKITAAETTGPAKGPLPTSSTPASIKLTSLLSLLQLDQNLLPLKINEFP